MTRAGRPSAASRDRGPTAGGRLPRWGRALASGALLAVAGRPWGLGWLALVAFVPLLGALREEESALHAGAYTGLAALGAAFIVYETIGPVAPAAVPALAAASSLPFAAVGTLAPRLRRVLGRRATALAFPLLWLAAEALPARSWLLGRFAHPLFAVGYSQAGLPAMQLARLGGVGAVGLAVLASNALLALRFYERQRSATVALALLTAAVAVVAATAPAPLRERTSGAATVALRVAQQALPDGAYAAAAALGTVRDRLVRSFVHDTLATPLPEGPGFTLWPEGALPGPLPAVRTSGLAPLLTGLGPALLGAAARVEGGVANAAFVWRSGELRRAYLKRRLAPLAEDALVPGHDLGLIAIGGVRAAPLICFEAAFPELARDAARAGAQVLAVLTNDAFAPFLATPRQHLRLARFRAVETGLPLALASNAGPSAVLDGAGRVLARTAEGRPGTAVARARLGGGPTPFVRWGDWPGTLALAASALLTLLAGARGGGPRP